MSEREFTRAAFEKAYDEVVLGGGMVEVPAYYHRYRGRYRRTLDYICRLDLPRPARILEIGGGQMALLLSAMFGDRCTLADVSSKYADSVRDRGLEHVVCDLMRDDLPARASYDAVILCEVIEHIPVPPHLIFEKIARWLKPGGALFLTTPNLYRLRNVVRLALGSEMFCNFYYPEPGRGLGHPLEYASSQMRWQLERAGLEVRYCDLVQLTNRGTKPLAKIMRPLLAPLLWLRPTWRDNIVACGTRPAGQPEAT